MTERAKIMEPIHNAEAHEIEALFVQRQTYPEKPRANHPLLF